MAHGIRNRLYEVLKNGDKSDSTENYLGCDIPTFKKHIEDQFRSGMNWANNGTVWQIDHIIPLMYKGTSGLDVVPNQVVIWRFHYLNCQPLWTEENLSKGDRYIIAEDPTQFEMDKEDRLWYLIHEGIPKMRYQEWSNAGKPKAKKGRKVNKVKKNKKNVLVLDI